MSEEPPRKRLKQPTLQDMFTASTNRSTKLKNSPPIITAETDSSQNIESSIECMKIESFSSNISAQNSVELMEAETKIEIVDSDEWECRNEKDDKDTRNKSQRKGQKSGDGSPHKKKKHTPDEQRDGAETHRKEPDQRRVQVSSPKGKSSPPKKGLKKFSNSPKKGQGPSPSKERENRKTHEEHTERRKLMAEAAERRFQARDTPSPDSEAPMSPDLFADDEMDYARQDCSESVVTWRGSPLASLPFINSSNVNVPAVCEAPDHTVMVQLPVPPDNIPAPNPPSYSDVWDQFHVRMPCSPKSLYPLGKGSDSLVPRWSVISKALSRRMESIADLQAAILEYNSRYAAKWRFRGLQALIEEEFEEEEQEMFFKKTLPAMTHLALSLPKLVTQPPPLLTRHGTYSITMSQMQVASLLANAFFCTFPRRNAKGSETEYASYPDINFNRLFYHRVESSLEKLKCIINYFRRVTNNEPTGTITFARQYVHPQNIPTWETSRKPIPRLHTDTEGLIEEQMGFLQVDFANKFIGGGVLGQGCVQEEIRFVLSPELLVSRLFTQVLEKTEALIVIGAEQFNKGVGYSSNFRWDGTHKDQTPRDPWGRRMCQVTAIDALHFTKKPQVQYRPSFLMRELNKAYTGYRVLDGSAGTPAAVATGNWGCGAFRGDPRLKSLLQLAVCGYLGRDVAYFTFGDQKLRNDLSTMHIFLKENNVTVGELVQVLNQYGMREWSDGTDLFQYIYHSLGGYDQDTDGEAEESKATDNKQGNLHVSKRTPSASHITERKISEYFSKTAKQQSSANMNDKESKGSNSSSGTKGDSGLTEQKILQVLTECDRLLEGQKGKNYTDGNSSSPKSSSDGQGKSCMNDKKAKGELMTEKKHKGQLSTSTSEPSRLLSYLDDIDKGIAS